MTANINEILKNYDNVKKSKRLLKKTIEKAERLITENSSTDDNDLFGLLKILEAIVNICKMFETWLKKDSFFSYEGCLDAGLMFDRRAMMLAELDRIVKGIKPTIDKTFRQRK